MRRLCSTAVCLCIAAALGAVGASGAWAQAPEIGRCVKVAKGSGAYGTSTCTKLKSGGDYEWLAGTAAGKNHFTGSGTKATLETIHKVKVTCTAESATGEFTGPKTVGNLHVTFTGCESLAKKCSTSGAAEGEVKVNTLAGELEWESKAKKTVAIDLFPQEGELFVTFHCGPAESKVKGSVLTNVKAGKMESTVTEKFSAKTGVQKPTQYETESGSKVSDFLEADIGATEFVQAGQTITNTQTDEESLEVNWFV